MGRKNRKSSAVESLAMLTLVAAANATPGDNTVTVTVTEPVAPPVPAMDANEVAALRRKDELATARAKYIKATGNAKSGGGSSLVAKCARDFGKTGNAYGEITTLANAIRVIDPVAAFTWAEKYIAEKESTKTELVDKKTKKIKPAGTPTDADAAALSAFKAYVNENRYVELAEALDVFVKYSAFTYTETFTDKAKNSCRRVVDVKDDVNAMFGFRVTAKVRLAGNAEF